MFTRLYQLLTAGALVLSLSVMPAAAKDSDVPKPFQGFQFNSQITIDYSDLNALLHVSVLNNDSSDRSIAHDSVAKTGSHLRQSINRLTNEEANRFLYEAFAKPKYNQYFHKIRLSLEKVPDQVPLRYLSKNEQLAYWLNLYNVTVIDQIIQHYPIRRLDDFFDDDNPFFTKKILTVSGVPLSLDDIRLHILLPKYDRDPLVLYGLYQGIIGGPSLRREAFTGDNVHRNLKANAFEFINSNRGTYLGRGKTLRVSSFYRRNDAFFPNFKTDLKKHLMQYIQGDERYRLQETNHIRANISDWGITDVYGSTRDYAASVNTNQAALMDSVRAGKGPGGQGITGVGATNLGSFSSLIGEHAKTYGRFSEDQVAKIKALNASRVNSEHSVTVTDLPSDTPKKEDKDKGH